MNTQPTGTGKFNAALAKLTRIAMSGTSTMEQFDKALRDVEKARAGVRAE